MNGRMNSLKQGGLVAATTVALLIAPATVTAQNKGKAPTATTSGKPAEASRWNRIKGAFQFELKNPFAKNEEREEGKLHTHAKQKQQTEKVVQTAAEEPRSKFFTKATHSFPMQSAGTSSKQTTQTKPTKPAQTKPAQPAQSKPAQPAQIKPTQPAELKPAQPAQTKSEIAKQLEALYAKSGMKAPSMDLSSLPKTVEEAQQAVEHRDRQAKRPSAKQPQLSQAAKQPAGLPKPSSPPAAAPVARPSKKPGLLQRLFPNRAARTSTPQTTKTPEVPVQDRTLRKSAPAYPTGITRKEDHAQTEEEAKSSLIPEFITRRFSKDEAAAAKPITEVEDRKTADVKPATPAKTPAVQRRIPVVEDPTFFPNDHRKTAAASKPALKSSPDESLKDLFPDVPESQADTAPKPEENPFAKLEAELASIREKLHDDDDRQAPSVEARQMDNPADAELKIDPAFEAANIQPASNPFSEPEQDDSFPTSPPAEVAKPANKPASKHAFEPAPQTTHPVQQTARTMPVPDKDKPVAGELADDKPQVGAIRQAKPVEMPKIEPRTRPAQTGSRGKLQRIAQRGTMTGLKGFCLVSLRDTRRLADALTEFNSSYDGHTYYFSSAEAKTSFDAAPERYVPAAGGNDIVELTDQYRERAGSLDYAVWYQGQLYLFHSRQTLNLFLAAPESYAR